MKISLTVSGGIEIHKNENAKEASRLGKKPQRVIGVGERAPISKQEGVGEGWREGT